METTPDNRVMTAFRDAEMKAAIEARQGTHTISEAVHAILDRYFFMLTLSMPDFSEAEASLLVDALNGTIFHKETVSLLWANIEDAIRTDSLDQKWQIDGASLLARLRDLKPFEALAVVDAVEQFWSGFYRQEGTMREKLLACGLLKPERKRL